MIETIVVRSKKQRNAHEAEQARIKAEEKKRLKSAPTPAAARGVGRAVRPEGVPDSKTMNGKRSSSRTRKPRNAPRGEGQASSLALNISGGDVALGALSDEEWTRFRMPGTSRCRPEKARQEKPSEEKERKNRRPWRYRKRFDFIARSGFTVDQVGTTLEDLKASDDEFMVLASKVKTLKDEREEKERKEQAEKRKDEAFRLRYQELLVMKVEFSTELAAKVREMPQDEYDLFKGAIETEFNRKADEEREAREAAMAPAPQVEAAPAEHPVKAWAEAIISSLEFAPGVEGPKAMDFQNLRIMAIETMKDIVTLFEEA